MTDHTPAAQLDAKGRCCGRKPIKYKREQHYFCHRCSRAFSLETGKQIPNWAWTKISDAEFRPNYPKVHP